MFYYLGHSKYLCLLTYLLSCTTDPQQIHHKSKPVEFKHVVAWCLSVCLSQAGVLSKR